VPTLSILTNPLIHVACFQEAVTLTYLLAWIPESLLTEKGKEEWNKFLKTEERPDEDEGMSRPCLLLSMFLKGGQS
jgi:hypothetical protein